jgi:RND family efflux transporter MFP subunit
LTTISNDFGYRLRTTKIFWERWVLRKIVRVILPLLVLVVAVMAAREIISSAPKPERKQAKPQVPVVDVVELQPSNYTFQITSQGVISPRTQSTMIPEVSGRLVEVSDNLRSGGYFKKGEVLARIDDRDYKLALTIVQAELSQAEVALQEEGARGAQARQDWDRIRSDTPPSDLVARRPQYEHAKAALAAAEARVAQAQLNHDRTRIVAPYDGRVLEMKADVGQYITPGVVIASVHSLDYGEVRLPLTDKRLAQIELSREGLNYRKSKHAPKVEFRLLDTQDVSWQGRITRSEGRVESSSRQHYLIGEIKKPFVASSSQPQLKVGQFLLATIEGRTLKNVYVVPRDVVQSGDELLVVTPEYTLERRKVEVVWRDSEHVVITRGVEAGEMISVTTVSYATNGRKVTIYSQQESENNKMKADNKE